MSLLNRSMQASRSAPCPFGVARGQFEMLQSQVQGVVSADEIAVMMRENPEKARSELRSACRQVLQQGRWSMLDEDQCKRLTRQLMDAVFGFGPIEELLADDAVTEIMVNGPAKVFYEKEGVIHRSSTAFSNEGQLRALIDRMLGPIGRRIDESSPMVNARLPEGHRVHAVLPPLSLEGPILTIRKFPSEVMTLEDMEGKGSIGNDIAMFFAWAVRARKSIAVSGGTGSGKTTLLNALSCKIPPSERIITIEDSAELRFLEHPHVVRLESRPENAEGAGQVTIRDLVTNALRMRPDRIVVGECRSAEALDMLQAMNTGHDGSLTTLHSNSPGEAVTRLSTMVRYAVDLPVDVIEANIADAFDVVVQVARFVDGRRYVSCLAELSFDEKKRRCSVQVLYRREIPDEKGVWLAIPEWVDLLPDRKIATRKEVEEWKKQLNGLQEQR